MVYEGEDTPGHAPKRLISADAWLILAVLLTMLIVGTCAINWEPIPDAATEDR